MHTFEVILLITSFVFLFGALDDLVVDLVYHLKRVRPLNPDREEWARWRKEDETPIAVMVPAWRESNVLEAMVSTNLRRIEYLNYRWYIGVYPNDVDTVEVAERLAQQYPELVTVVVTDRPGPTSKAHCLNCILRKIESEVHNAAREDRGWIPKFLAIHDAEDVIHPKAFLAVHGQPKDLDFIQVPIFSLPVSVRKLIAGTYMDEFAELHLKELPSRQHLGMPIPSAGVGTFFSWKILQALKDHYGYIFDENNLTEDYEVSLRISRIRGKQTFLVMRDESGDFVATRGFFPDQFWPSVRQKTRWTTGITLQTAERWKFYGATKKPLARINLALIYALHRDRRALWSNPATIVAWFFALCTMGVLYFRPDWIPPLKHEALLNALFVINLCMVIYRALNRIVFSTKVYGKRHGLMGGPRIFVSNVVNALSTVRAIYFYVKGQNRVSHKRNQAVVQKVHWDKTDHKFPTLENISEASSLARRKSQNKNVHTLSLLLIALCALDARAAERSDSRFTDIYSELHYQDITQTLSVDIQARHGLQFQYPASTLQAYLMGRVQGDNNTLSSTQSGIYNDNYAALYAGFDAIVLPGVRLRSQLGVSKDLSDKIALGGLELNAGLITYHEFVVPLPRVHAEAYSEALYYRRYKNFLPNARLSLLWKVYESGKTLHWSLAPCAASKISYDSQGLNYNRFFEEQLGVRLQLRASGFSTWLNPQYVLGTNLMDNGGMKYPEFRVLWVFAMNL